jgi:hypothetical protein
MTNDGSSGNARRAETERALKRFDHALEQLDEIYTELTVAKKLLIGFRRELDPLALAEKSDGEVTDFLGKLLEITVAIEDLQRMRVPRRAIDPPRRPKESSGRTRLDWEEEARDLLARRPVDRPTILRAFHLLSPRSGFPMLANLLEELEGADELARYLPVLSLAELLESMSGVGVAQARRVHEFAELPQDVYLEDLGRADVERLCAVLRLCSSGIPRDLSDEVRARLGA